MFKKSGNPKAAPINIDLAILEEYARETVLEAFSPDDCDLGRYPIRVLADRVDFDVDSWFSYRVAGTRTY
jgi:hypothetical protein